MSEEPRAAPDAVEVLPLPQIIDIPNEAIARWQAIPSESYVVVPFQRADLDALFHSLRQSAIAQLSLGNALQAYSHGDLDRAQAEFRQHQETVRHSLSNVNIFIAKVMSVVTTEPPHG